MPRRPLALTSAIAPAALAMFPALAAAQAPAPQSAPPQPYVVGNPLGAVRAE